MTVTAREKPWTPEETALLCKLWHVMPTRLIAERLNRTEKSVAGRSYRMQLGPKEMQEKVLKRIKKMKEPKMFIKLRNKNIIKYDLLPVFNDPDNPGISIMDHKSNQCCWPVHHMRFCGKELMNKSYCQKHYILSRADKTALQSTKAG